mgnify:CR=1 FL=1
MVLALPLLLILGAAGFLILFASKASEKIAAALLDKIRYADLPPGWDVWRHYESDTYIVYEGLRPSPLDLNFGNTFLQRTVNLAQAIEIAMMFNLDTTYVWHVNGWLRLAIVLDISRAPTMSDIIPV